MSALTFPFDAMGHAQFKKKTLFLLLFISVKLRFFSACPFPFDAMGHAQFKKKTLFLLLFVSVKLRFFSACPQACGLVNKCDSVAELPRVLFRIHIACLSSPNLAPLSFCMRAWKSGVFMFLVGTLMIARQRTTFLQSRKCLLNSLLLVPLEIQVGTGKGKFKYHLKTGDISPQSTQMWVHNLSLARSTQAGCGP